MYFEEISIPCDLYGRNATEFIHGTNNIKDEVYISYLDKECNAKSLLGVLSLGLKKNDIICLRTNSSNHTNVFNQVKNAMYSL